MLAFSIAVTSVVNFTATFASMKNEVVEQSVNAKLSTYSGQNCNRIACSTLSVRKRRMLSFRRPPHVLEFQHGFYILTECELYDIPEESEFIVSLSSQIYRIMQL